MNRFEIIATPDLNQASRLLAEPYHAALAGGVDLLDLLKQRVVGPKSLVNLKALEGIDTVKSDGKGGLQVGALVKMHQVATDPLIGTHFTALSQAAGKPPRRRFVISQRSAAISCNARDAGTFAIPTSSASKKVATPVTPPRVSTAITRFSAAVRLTSCIHRTLHPR